MKHRVEVVIYDETAQEVRDLFLPPNGTHLRADEIERACERLVAATKALKRLRAGQGRVS